MLVLETNPQRQQNRTTRITLLSYREEKKRNVSYGCIQKEESQTWKNFLVPFQLNISRFLYMHYSAINSGLISFGCKINWLSQSTTY